MTKMKNTKKGMAKKALSISLIAAMLATSNVPVWAAFEAEDPSEVIVETVEAPVDPTVEMADNGFEVEAAEVEEPGVENYATITEQGDVLADITLNKKEVEWDTEVTVTGSLKDKNTDADLTGWYYGWREQGTTESYITPVWATSVSDMKLTSDQCTADMAGKTIELYIYNTEGDYNIQPMAIATLKVTAKALKNTNVDVEFTNSASQLTYNGFTQDVADKVSKVSFSKSTDITDKVQLSGSSVKNAGDDYTLTVSADDPAYSGTVTFNYTMLSKSYAPGDIEASLKANLEYEYTGDATKINIADVTAKESTSENSGADGKLGGADLTSAIKSVAIKSTGSAFDVGDYTATVTIDKDKLDNLTSIADVTVDTDNKLAIVPRDLSKVTVVIGSNNEVLLDSDASAASIKFYADGKELALKAADYDVIFKDDKGEVVKSDEKFDKEGSYTATITKKGKNTVNEQTVTFRAEGNVIDKAEGSEFTNFKADYTGNEIKPTKADIGSLTVTGKGATSGTAIQDNEWTIVGYGNNINVPDASAEKPYVLIKVLAGTFRDKTAKLYFDINPLTVVPKDITVPKSVIYDSSVKKAKEYNLPVSVVAKNSNGKVSVTLKESDYTTGFAFTADKDGNKVGNTITTTITVTNKNFTKGTTVVAETKTKISNPALATGSVKVNPSSYAYTGGTIEPKFVVMDGTLELEKDVDYNVVSITNAVDVGTGTIKVQGIGNYSGEATADFTITPASMDDVKVTIKDMEYTGKKVRPAKADMSIMLNGNDVSDQFDITAYGDNIQAGQNAGSVTLTLKKGNKNFSTNTKTVTFNIVTKKITGTLTAYDSFGAPITTDKGKTFKYDGTAKTFASVKLTGLPNGVSASDFDIKYVDNIYGKTVTGETKGNVAWVYAVAKEGVNYSGSSADIVTADGTVIKGAVAAMMFYIESPVFTKSNVTVKNGVYASGMPVKPDVLVQFGGNTLVEGQDYTLKLTSDVAGNTVITPTEVTNGKVYYVTVIGKGGYAGVGSVAIDDKWGIDKFNYKDADITVANGQVTVKNGNVIVPSSDYDVKDNENGTYTISAKAGSKNYTGSKTVEAQVSAVPEITASSDPVVDRNMINVSVAKPVEDAAAYDYVLCESEADLAALNFYKYNMSVDGTASQFQFVRAGSYKVYARAIIRDADGKKAYSDWSEAADVTISTDTPNATTINSVTVNGNKVTVTFTPGARTEGVDVMLGQTLRSSNGEPQRPVTSNFTKYLKKNLNATAGRRQTVTFTNVAKGTHYIGVHPYINSNDQYKYFGRWSQQTGATKVVIK